VGFGHKYLGKKVGEAFRVMDSMIFVRRFSDKNVKNSVIFGQKPTFCPLLKVRFVQKWSRRFAQKRAKIGQKRGKNGFFEGFLRFFEVAKNSLPKNPFIF
jgi:hypothetical protein